MSASVYIGGNAEASIYRVAQFTNNQRNETPCDVELGSLLQTFQADSLGARGARHKWVVLQCGVILGTTAEILFDVLSKRLPEKTWGLDVIETPVDEDDAPLVAETPPLAEFSVLMHVAKPAVLDFDGFLPTGGRILRKEYFALHKIGIHEVLDKCIVWKVTSDA